MPRSHPVRRSLALVALAAAALAATSCAALQPAVTKLDAAEAEANAANVRELATENERLHVAAGAADATLAAVRAFNASAIGVADDLVEATR